MLSFILAVLIILETNGESVSSSPLVFLNIESRSTAERLRSCDDCAKLVNLPTDIKIGNFTFNKTYVSSNGLFSFGQPYTFYVPQLFPLSSVSVVAPFWDDIDLGLPTDGTLVYELVTKGHATNIINDVNTFISNHQMIQFNADWVLVAKWIDVCPFSDRSCNNTQPNTYQAIIATQLELSYAVFTYKCDLLRWTLHNASVGFSAGPYFYSNHPLSGTTNVTNIDCINYPNSPWYNVVYNLNEKIEQQAATIAIAISFGTVVILMILLTVCVVTLVVICLMKYKKKNLPLREEKGENVAAVIANDVEDDKGNPWM